MPASAARSRSAAGPARLDVPAWLILPAAVGAAVLVLPIVGILSQVHWTQLPALLLSEGSRAAFWLSLKTSTASTALCFLLGVPLALVLARLALAGRNLIRPLVLLPLVLPPVVAGIALLSTFGRRGLLGQSLQVLGVQVAFTTTAVVLAQTFVSMPFLVVSLEGALRTVDVRYGQVAATLGASPGVALRRVTLPMLAPALVAGGVLCFARALGEFGATITFAGSLQGTTRTLPLEVYLQRETDPAGAVALSLLLMVVAVAVIAVAARLGERP